MLTGLREGGFDLDRGNVVFCLTKSGGHLNPLSPVVLAVFVDLVAAHLDAIIVYRRSPDDHEGVLMLDDSGCHKCLGQAVT